MTSGYKGSIMTGCVKYFSAARLCCLLLAAAGGGVYADETSLIDFFLPPPPCAAPVSEGIWGETNVVPRDVSNGLEDARLEKWCYWDGNVLKGPDGRYHMYAVRWSQSHSHSRGHKSRSAAVHAVAGQPMGPYLDAAPLWPGRADEMSGRSTLGLHLKDGRYAVFSAGSDAAELYVADAPQGPFERLGRIETAPAGDGERDMLNACLLERPDGRCMMVLNSGMILISEAGILGPYKKAAPPAFEGIRKLPQVRMEDPLVWYGSGLYHMVVHHWRSGSAYHLTSADGISNWTYRGIAYRTGGALFRGTDGTVNAWEVVERPGVLMEEGVVTHFTFSVIDVSKGEDGPHDRNGSKIVVVPFDGRAFDQFMRKLVAGEEAGEDGR